MDHRVRPAAGERAPQRRALAEQVPLADDLVDRARAQAHSERRLARRHARARALRAVIGGEQLAFHAISIARRQAARPRALSKR